MTIQQVQTGDDLYHYVQQLLEQKDKETESMRANNPLRRVLGNEITAYPTLIDYLLSLWSVAEKHRNVEQVTLSLIAQMLEDAFTAPLKEIDWNKLVKEGFLPWYKNKTKTPEFYAEIRTYEKFETDMHNHVIALKALLTYGYEALGGNEMDSMIDGNKYFWENRGTASFLQAGINQYYGSKKDGKDLKYPISWCDLSLIVYEGRFNEQNWRID